MARFLLAKNVVKNLEILTSFWFDLSPFVLLLDHIDTHGTILLCLKFRTEIYMIVYIQISIWSTLPDTGAKKSFTTLI